MPSHQIKEEPSYRRALFVAASLALAGICSVYPLMCFKNYSAKEKSKMNKGVENVDRQQAEREAHWRQEHPPRVRHHSQSPPKIAHRPDQSRRRSSTRPSSLSRKGDHRRRHRDESLDSYARGSARSEASGAYDRELDRERRQRHSGYPPPRRYHHSS
ncbi:hypothetical protein Tdes44962_MAKER06845 [Teratosphaeria destructans]|uniref:Uncharacterized protein n=1 Tax=Teratosphaeria destructans TaxID=418781 RepID=A0A9W7T141_9PEZI|nr:hypothetical protein Tdes44962_MAKER06845 [Teratosphaeria destructans]